MFADVTSANIVGYSNKVANNTDKGVSKMLSGSFVNVGTNSVHLTDLSFTGYQDISQYRTSGTGNSFYMAKLTSGGEFEHQYVWKDTYNTESGAWAGGYWYDAKTDKIIEKNTDDDITIEPGDGFWCSIGRNRKSGSIYIVWPKVPGMAE